MKKILSGQISGMSRPLIAIAAASNPGLSGRYHPWALGEIEEIRALDSIA
jgi:hypothetical protein